MSRFKDFMSRLDRFTIAEKIILINIVCFIIPFFLRTFFFLFNLPEQAMYTWFELSPHASLFLYRPWTLFTYAFLHGSIGHILWNMLLLYYASRLFLNLFSAQKFINVYFLGLITGGVVFLMSYALFPVFKGLYPPLVGASAGVMAILIFSCTYSPQLEIRLLFFNLKLMYLGIGLVVLDVLQIPSGNAGGHLAHLGGAALGYFYANQLQKGNDIGTRFELVWKWIVGLFDSKPRMEKVYKTTKKTAKTSSPDQSKIDAILDKISISGYDSLTKEEKEFLFKAGKN